MELYQTVNLTTKRQHNKQKYYWFFSQSTLQFSNESGSHKRDTGLRYFDKILANSFDKVWDLSLRFNN